MQQNSSGNCSKEHSFEDSSSKSKTGIHADRSTSSFSSLTWSTGSKESSINGGPQNNNISHRDERNYSQRASEICVEITDFTEDPNEVHYEEIGAILRYPLQSQNHAHINQERPKSEQLMNYQQNTSYNQAYQMQHSQDDVMTRYGRILPSKMHPNEAEIMASPLRYGSAESISHRNGTALTSIQHKSAKFQQNYQRMNGNSMARNSNGLLRAGVPNATLPSPESAYSTGYSTDGTSPSAVYTPPEYYINMRSGTHYFPKNSHSLAIETKRYKFGLNKIEEMSPLDPQV